MDYEKLFESVIKSLDDGVIVVDKECCIKFYNEPKKGIWELEPKTVIGRNLLEVFDGATTKTSTLCHVLKTQKPLIGLIQTYVNSKGDEKVVVTTTVPLIEDGEIFGAIKMYKNLSNLRRLISKVSKISDKLHYKETKEYTGNGTMFTLDDICTHDEQMLIIKEKARQIADSDSPVLVYGETGTGKELLVQGIHNASMIRRDKPFIAQNCAAMPRDLLESLIFGTSAGSFTGAKDKPGLFEMADGGTLFLDELCSMDIHLQAKILRVLQDGVIRRVGGVKTTKVNVRVIAATNIKPENAIEKEMLRSDLYYRLNVISFSLPPLSKRKNDINVLVNSFVDYYNKKLHKNMFCKDDLFIEYLKRYNWPGNVRELKYTIESMMNLSEKDELTVYDLPLHITNFNKHDEDMDTFNLKEMMDEYEKQLLVVAIKKSEGNCSKAAKSLGIPRQTLYNKIKKYEIAIRNNYV